MPYAVNAIHVKDHVSQRVLLAAHGIHMSYDVPVTCYPEQSCWSAYGRVRDMGKPLP